MTPRKPSSGQGRNLQTKRLERVMARGGMPTPPAQGENDDESGPHEIGTQNLLVGIASDRQLVLQLFQFCTHTHSALDPAELWHLDTSQPMRGAKLNHGKEQ